MKLKSQCCWKLFRRCWTSWRPSTTWWENARTRSSRRRRLVSTWRSSSRQVYWNRPPLQRRRHNCVFICSVFCFQQKMDKNKDGVVTIDEFIDCCQNVKQPSRIGRRRLGLSVTLFFVSTGWKHHEIDAPVWKRSLTRRPSGDPRLFTDPDSLSCTACYAGLKT